MTVTDNFQAAITPAVGSNNVIVVATPPSESYEIESLIAIIDLRQSPRNVTERSLFLKFREEGQQDWSLIAEISMQNRSSIYRENLLKYLTSTDRFVLSRASEIGLQLTGTPLKVGEFVSSLGFGSRPGSTNSNGGTVNQTFVTATYSVPDREALRIVPLTSNWVGLDTERSPKFYKDQIGRVHLTGFARQLTPTPNNLIGTLPVGFRPTETLDFMCNHVDAMRPVQIQTDGRVLMTSSTTSWVNLTGISFLAA